MSRSRSTCTPDRGAIHNGRGARHRGAGKPGADQIGFAEFRLRIRTNRSPSTLLRRTFVRRARHSTSRWRLESWARWALLRMPTNICSWASALGLLVRYRRELFAQCPAAEPVVCATSQAPSGAHQRLPDRRRWWQRVVAQEPNHRRHVPDIRLRRVRFVKTLNVNL